MKNDVLENLSNVFKHHKTGFSNKVLIQTPRIYIKYLLLSILVFFNINLRQERGSATSRPVKKKRQTERPTDQQTNRTTNQQTSMMVLREVTLSIIEYMYLQWTSPKASFLGCPRPFKIFNPHSFQFESHSLQFLQFQLKLLSGRAKTD